MAKVSSDQISNRLMDSLLSERIMDNSLRGYWCEAMVAEALGPECKLVSQGWYPWDLQIGPDESEVPDRIRIQVKNSARLQQWNLENGKLSDCQFNLKYSKRPDYFERDYPGVACEDCGFLPGSAFFTWPMVSLFLALINVHPIVHPLI